MDIFHEVHYTEIRLTSTSSTTEYSDLCIAVCELFLFERFWTNNMRAEIEILSGLFKR
ncbi:hypothetical protein OJIADAOI_00001 [Pseudomonas phage SPA05]|uniref:Uncharacterized protein n=1 Tax=Pseudomonas phage SPA05 TaxID=3003720 RepID=A0AAF0DQQ9_9CAUD|nr:hypothetical protein QE323_gp001 [Pseudomonas phage SPA05]WEY17787.1 hypothetical protein OJIADAOI_00001 [Pseudomonas phage SPA05]